MHTTPKINIGGGPGFNVPGWINLDEMARPSFKFSADCKFPLEDGSVELVYSSHAIEHLNDETVAQVLEESWRVLVPSGRLVIKLPDFDAILAAYRRGDSEYFDRGWNIGSVIPTLANRGMVDSVATRAAWLLCGFWNAEFGHMFGGYDPNREGAYNGPPVMGQEELQAILEMDSPHAMAGTLRAHVIENETDYTFNHQNAWSREEFAALLGEHGFTVARDTPDGIPGIDEMRPISMYFDGRKDGHEHTLQGKGERSGLDGGKKGI